MELKYTIEELPQVLETNNIIAFWKPKNTANIGSHVLTQWHKCKFKLGNFQYNNTEQYMMMEKAKLFEDDFIYEQLKKPMHPKEYKALGRKIRGFEEKTWDKAKVEIVYKGNHAKFTQNKDLEKYLVQTKDKIIIEASPYDTVWGIGLAVTSDDLLIPENWKGENLLGFILMQVREEIR